MSEGIVGCIARVEPTAYYREFLEVVRPEWAMLKLHHASQLVDSGETADSWAPHTKLITTSTINDPRLEEISWQEERDIVRSFQPQRHIPTDVSVYRDQSTADRVEGIKNCMTGAAYMQSELATVNTEIIPLFKGYTRSERNLSLQAVDALDASRVAIYVSRYFSGNRGNNRKRLFHHLERYAEHNMPPVMLIGLLSPKYLERVPDYVIAASGQNQWRDRYDPDSQTAEESRVEYEILSQAASESLDLPLQRDAQIERTPPQNTSTLP
jgi:hypothetical protein